MTTRRLTPAPRRHVYVARSAGKGCSPAKTASARINGCKGGRPPLHRYHVAELAGGGWVVADRTGQELPRLVPSHYAGRRLARALNLLAPSSTPQEAG